MNGGKGLGEAMKASHRSIVELSFFEGKVIAELDNNNFTSVPLARDFLQSSGISRLACADPKPTGLRKSLSDPDSADYFIFIIYASIVFYLRTSVFN